MSLLTVDQAATLLNMPALLDGTIYPSAYIDGVLAAIESDVSTYLGWNPALSTYDEEGLAHLVMSGPYIGRYFIELKNQPLVPGTAADIFSNLQLTYPIAFIDATNVALEFVKVMHNTGQIFCLAPGAPEALVGGIGWGYAPLVSAASAVSYAASYAAGFACGNDTDPTKDESTSYGAAPLPAGIRDAALLLLRERLSMDALMNQNPENPQVVQRYRVRVGEREESYRSFQKAQAPSKLGFGGGLAEAAEAKLKQYVRRHTPIFA